MKAKFYTLFLSALLLAALSLSGQMADNRGYRNGGAQTVINNYYDDYDYYYSSRINRFHRSYSAFDYYSPVFTDAFWYSWQPYSWGVSIYGRSGFGFGYSINYPVYYGYSGWYGYDYGWYDPYYGSSWYVGYDPFYFSWYSPFRWHNHWYGNNYWYGGYRPIYNTYNYYYNYPSTRYSNREFSTRPGYTNRTNSGGVERRQSVTLTGRDAGTPVNRTNAGASNTSRRTGNTDTEYRGQSNVNANRPALNAPKGTTIVTRSRSSASQGRSTTPSQSSGSVSQRNSTTPSRSSGSVSQSRSSSPSRSSGSVSRSSSSSSRSSGSVRSSSSSSSSKSSGSSSRSSSSSSNSRSRR